MRQLDLGKYSKAHVWINEFPNFCCQPGLIRQNTISKDAQTMHILQAAIEVFVPLGPRSMYGLLGGEFIPSLNGPLKVSILTSLNNEKLLTSSLASPEDQVWTGLPTEYYDAVREGVFWVQQEVLVSSGEFVINCAAYAEIGSCAAIYKHLAIVLMKLINTHNMSLSDNEIISLFPSRYS